MTFLEKLPHIRLICVHDGRFHWDDVLAVALLRCAGCPAPVIRARDIDAFPDDGTVLYIDVGGSFDGIAHFDHHQRGSLLRSRYYAPMDDRGETPFCAAGLLWQVMGHAYGEREGLEGDELERFFRKVDQKLIQPADFQDNGICSPLSEALTLGEAFAALNSPDLDDKDGQNCRFEWAARLAAELIGEWFESIICSLQSERRVRICLERAVAEGKDYAFIPSGMGGPWRTLIQNDPELWEVTQGLKAVITERPSDHTYRITMMPLSRYDHFACRYILPKELKDWYPEVQFIHPNGFTGALTDLENLDEIMKSLKPNQGV